MHRYFIPKPDCAQVTKIRRADGKIIGEVKGLVFQKRLRASRHFLRVPPAIAFDVQSLHDAERAGARVVCVIDDESGWGYAAAIEKIWRRGRRFNRGYGEQIFLPLHEWRTDDKVVLDELLAEAVE